MTEQDTQEKIQQLKYLIELKSNIKKSDQTVEREFNEAILDMEIIALKSELRVKAIKRAIIFLEVWRNNGNFEAISFDGARMRADPVVTGIPIQDLWNARSKAYFLANWSFGIDSHWIA